MPSSATIRVQVESALANKFPSALTPRARMLRPVVSSGITVLDDLVQGGFPVGAMTELVGNSCSGRMSVALSFLAQVTAAEKVCAWIPHTPRQPRSRTKSLRYGSGSPPGER